MKWYSKFERRNRTKKEDACTRKFRREIFVGTEPCKDSTLSLRFREWCDDRNYLRDNFCANSTNREITGRSEESCSPSFLLARVCNGAPSNLLPKSCFRCASRIRDYGENLLGLSLYYTPPLRLVKRTCTNRRKRVINSWGRRASGN